MIASRLALKPCAGGILVTENGCAVADDDVKAAKNDTFRVEYFLGAYDTRRVIGRVRQVTSPSFIRPFRVAVMCGPTSPGL